MLLCQKMFYTWISCLLFVVCRTLLGAHTCNTSNYLVLSGVRCLQVYEGSILHSQCRPSDHTNAHNQCGASTVGFLTSLRVLGPTLELEVLSRTLIDISGLADKSTCKPPQSQFPKGHMGQLQQTYQTLLPSSTPACGPLKSRPRTRFVDA